MTVKKIGIGDIPKEVLGDLEVLLAANVKDYVAIGANYYEICPTPAIKLMSSLSRFLKMIDNMRGTKADILNSTNNTKLNPYEVLITHQDVIADPEAITEIQKILTDILEGIDPEDLDKISIGQVMDTITKLIKINIDTLPESFKEQFLVAVPKTPEEEKDPLESSTSEPSQD